jgi:hypothetical protein
MTEEVRVLVTLQVDNADDADPVDRHDKEVAAVEAVANALRAAYENGFCHQLANRLAIGFVDAVLSEEYDENKNLR